MSVETYWKKKIKNQDLSVEYSSEEDMVTICYDHKLTTGTLISKNYLTIHPSYIEPLCELLRKVMEKEDGE